MLTCIWQRPNRLGPGGSNATLRTRVKDHKVSPHGLLLYSEGTATGHWHDTNSPQFSMWNIQYWLRNNDKSSIYRSAQWPRRVRIMLLFIYALINLHFLVWKAARVSETAEIVENRNSCPEAEGHDFNIPNPPTLQVTDRGRKLTPALSRGNHSLQQF